MSTGSGAGTRTAAWPAARVPGEAPGTGLAAGQPPPAAAKGKAKRQPLHGKPRFGAVTLLTFFLLLLTLIPSNLVFAPLGGVGTPANMAALAILLWYVLSWITGRILPTGAGRPVRIAIFIFGLAVVASFIAAMTRSIVESEILAADRGLLQVLVFAALIVVPSQTITSYERLDTLLRRAVILGAVVGGIGIGEFYTGINITNYIHIPGLSPATDVFTLLDRNGFNRPSSTAIQPIEFGVVMAMLLPFALQQAFDPERPGGKIRKWLPVALLFFAIPMSLSRSGILGLAVAVLFIIPTWPPRRRKPAWVVLLLGVASLKVVAPGLIGTFVEYFGGLSGSSNSDVSVSTRTADYAAEFKYIVERPFFGRGFGTFMPELYRYTDNTYLLGLVEFGIVGVLALLILYFAGMHCAAAGRHLTTDLRQRELGQALIAAFWVALVSGATFDALTFPMFSGLLFLFLGCAGAYLGLMRAQSQGRTVNRLGTIWLANPREESPFAAVVDARPMGAPRPKGTATPAASSPQPSSSPQSNGNGNSARNQSPGEPH